MEKNLKNSVCLRVYVYVGASLDGSAEKNPPAVPGEAGDPGSVPVSGRSPGGGHGNQFQYSCLGNPMDRGAKWATYPRGHKELDMTEVTEYMRARTHTHTHTHTVYTYIN